MNPQSREFAKADALLKTTRLFSSLDTSTRHTILEVCEIIHWKKGDAIDSERGMRYCHIILEGRMKITQIDPKTGRSIAPFLLTHGDIYDIFSLLDGKPHETFPVVMDSVTALYAPIQTAREWIMIHPELNKAFLPYLGSLMRQLEAFGESMVFDDTATRLAKLILRHTLPKESDDTDHYPVKLINNLSHESLAEMIGSVRSVVNTQLRKLKQEEVLLSRRGHLAVKNLERLLKRTEDFQR